MDVQVQRAALGADLVLLLLSPGESSPTPTTPRPHGGAFLMPERRHLVTDPCWADMTEIDDDEYEEDADVADETR